VEKYFHNFRNTVSSANIEHRNIFLVHAFFTRRPAHKL